MFTIRLDSLRMKFIVLYLNKIQFQCGGYKIQLPQKVLKYGLLLKCNVAEIKLYGMERQKVKKI